MEKTTKYIQREFYGMNFNKILLTIPTYNNESTIQKVIESAKKYISNILIINDGSTDNTSQILRQNSDIFLLTHEKNKGKGAALLTAFQYAKDNGYENIISMDADGQHFAEDIPLFIQAILENKNKIIIGNRNFENNPNIQISSKFGRHFSNFWIKIETGISFPDTQSGFRAYPVAKTLFHNLKKLNYDFEIEILVRAAWTGIEFLSIPISVYYPPPSERISHFKPFLDNMRLTRLHTSLVLKSILMTKYKKKLSPKSIPTERKGSFLMPFFLRYFGLSFCYFFSPLVVFFYFIFHKISRNGILVFYKNLGETNLFLRYTKAFQNYLYFTSSLLDRLSLAHGKQQFHVIKKIGEQLDKKENKSFILVGSHFGDFTLCADIFKKKSQHTIALLLDENSSKKYQTLLKKNNLYSYYFYL